MDILNPHLINIDGRIYCKYNVERQHEVPEEIATISNSTWDDEPTCETIGETEENVTETESVDVTKSSDGKFQLSVSIPSAFFKYIIGTRGDTKKRLEYETKTRVKIPGKGCTGDIMITGNNSTSVISAKNRIDLIVSSKRWKQPFTHFISIPLNNDTVKCRFMEFEKDVLADFSSNRGVEKSLFQNPCKLHLTICTLVLLDDKEIENAKAVFKTCYADTVREILGERPLEINVEQLEYMNDDPGSVDVLYAKVRCSDDSNTLQLLADRLLQVFSEAGFSEKQYDHVKLHCTLMNTTFRQRKSEIESTNQRKPKQSFDASQILTKYKDFDFGRVVVDEVHLSQRSSVSQASYYTCTDKITLS